MNGHVILGDKLRHDTLDQLMETVRRFILVVGCVPGLLKVDIDAAFRRIPVAPEQRWACGIAFVVAQTVRCALSSM